MCFLQKPDLFDLTDNSPSSMTLMPSWEHCQNLSANHFIYVVALAPCVNEQTNELDELRTYELEELLPPKTVV